ncbi:hypothetical protein [Brenneria goodwinii]|uniref:hypothetical protein n=1 Tax=Brenneria goodwinii TaxID=1109412 RepID=UPI000EF2713D|nr:hypothetical protein [Brenneria goodwinii]RLM22761.1 hypothetical protein BIY28_08630 [Brenneria goodwinii]
MRGKFTSVVCLFVYCLIFFWVLGFGYRLIIGLLSYLLTDEWAIKKAELVRIFYFGGMTGCIAWLGILIFKLLDKFKKKPPSDS